MGVCECVCVGKEEVQMQVGVEVEWKRNVGVIVDSNEQFRVDAPSTYDSTFSLLLSLFNGECYGA